MKLYQKIILGSGHGFEFQVSMENFAATSGSEEYILFQKKISLSEADITCFSVSNNLCVL